ncbi:MAG TPA: TIGR03435 family protein [Bryobacteraceae bacterium]|jgi:uncharacterized protein (TIGR03435 family)|nr:TIGR03435 family protein [Bryobacteraceae bacterium]
MKRPFACTLLTAVFAAGAIGQSTSATPSFDAADVHVSAKSPNAYMTTAFRSGRYELRKATMLDLIRVAYGVDTYKIAGGPGWLEIDRFDIIAKAPSASDPEALKAMLKTLLAERFKLVVHNDTKPIPTFFLTERAKKNMKPGDNSGDAANGQVNGQMGCQFTPFPPPQPGGSVGYDTMNCHNATMQSFIDAMRYPASPYLGVGPVLEKTGIEGRWDFTLKWTRRAMLQQSGSDAITLFDAVDKQLGLKLESRNEPTPVVVVDHVEQHPTENVTGVTQRLGPAPVTFKEFEVADVKPTRPGGGGNFRIEPNGRVELRGITLQNLITLAWNTDAEMLVGAPKWLNAERFDILAKAPTEEGPRPAQVDFDTIQVMMRALLAERFKVAVHESVQPVNVYALVAPKRETKMKKADDSNRASCKYAPELLPAKTALTNIYSCQNTTIGDFADKLRGWAPQYFDRPVVDLTGVDGSYDFTLGWTGRGRMPNAMNRPPDGGQPGGLNPASDPNSGITIFEAVERQLGLKLEERKHPMPVLVIDHVEQTPTDN